MPTTSVVWKFFTKVGSFSPSKKSGDAVVCKVCDKKMRQQNGSTSNMRSHLVNSHPKEFFGSTASPSTFLAATSAKTLSNVKRKLSLFTCPSDEDTSMTSQSSVVTTPIDTSDGNYTAYLWHVLNHPSLWSELSVDRKLKVFIIKFFRTKQIWLDQFIFLIIISLIQI